MGYLMNIFTKKAKKATEFVKKATTVATLLLSFK